MPRSHRAWRALLVLEITILLLSVPILGMVCYLIAFSNSSGNITVNVRNDQGVASDYTVAQLPTKLQMGPTWAFFANGLGGTIDSLLCIALLIGMKKTGFRQRWMHFVLLFVCFVSVVRSITAVVYGWSQDNSVELDPSLFASNAVYPSPESGQITLYGWSQQIQAVIVDGGLRKRFAGACSITIAVRALSVPLAVLDVVAMLPSVLLLRRES